MANNLIGISGKLHSGKDTVGKIIQILTSFPQMSNERVIEHLDKQMSNNTYEIKKFADALKDCVCIIIGCTREQLEDQEFKETPLGPEWDITLEHYRHYITQERAGGHGLPDTMPMNNYEFGDRKYTSISEPPDSMIGEMSYNMTPRLMLQLLGTQCGRQIIHPNIWVNATFAKYNKRGGKEEGGHVKFESVMDSGTSVYSSVCRDCGTKFYTKNKYQWLCEEHYAELTEQYPNWIFTDMRFPNELEAVESRGGITIRVNRPDKQLKDSFQLKNRNGTITNATIHESETALDKAHFKWLIENDGTLSDLVTKTRFILKSEKII